MVLEVRVYDDSFGAKNSLEVDVADLDGKTELEPVVDRDLDKFAEFYARTLNNGPLSGFERAAIKTYLYWKTHPEKK